MNKNQQVVLDYCDTILFVCVDALDNDYTNIFDPLYPDDTEDIYTKIPDPKIDDLGINVFVDLYHTHEKNC